MTDIGRLTLPRRGGTPAHPESVRHLAGPIGRDLRPQTLGRTAGEVAACAIGMSRKQMQRIASLTSSFGSRPKCTTRRTRSQIRTRSATELTFFTRARRSTATGRPGFAVPLGRTDRSWRTPPRTALMKPGSPAEDVAMDRGRRGRPRPPRVQSARSRGPGRPAAGGDAPPSTARGVHHPGRDPPSQRPARPPGTARPSRQPSTRACP